MKDNPKLPVVLTAEQRTFIEKLLTENENAIKYIIRKTLGRVYGYLNDECIGELCLLMCDKISDIEVHPNPRAWVMASAKLTAFSVINKNKNHAKFTTLNEEQPTKTDPTFEDALYSLWMKNDVPQKLLDTLTKREKQIYQKLYVQNKNIETTGRELGIASSTVRTIKKTLTDKILEHIRKNI
ncbi:MAG: sigma-70 family RNA polymerase sigma factor [Clostridia bacterium]|nr:sigma-70 family RNA polymerase sigma factor [Clostridia bacterium]